MLRRDLHARAAGRRARRRRCALGRQPGPPGGLPLAVQALERRRPALGLRRRRSGGDRGLRPPAQLCGGGPAAAGAGRRDRPVAGRGACRGEPRALPREVRPRRASGSAAGSAIYRPDGGFFLWLEVGDGEAAARRLWAEAAIKVLPGAYLGRPDAARRQSRAMVRSGSRWCMISRPPMRRCAGLVADLSTRAGGTRMMAAPSAPRAERGGIAGFLARRASEALGALPARSRRWPWPLALLGPRSQRSLAQPRHRRAGHQSARLCRRQHRRPRRSRRSGLPPGCWCSCCRCGACG